MTAKFDGKHARANMWVTHQNLARAKGGRPLYQFKERKGAPVKKAAAAPLPSAEPKPAEASPVVAPPVVAPPSADDPKVAPTE